VASRAIPNGALKLANVPTPSAEIDSDEPAIVSATYAENTSDKLGVHVLGICDIIGTLDGRYDDCAGIDGAIDGTTEGRLEIVGR
jgi:hypothetical protein